MPGIERDKADGLIRPTTQTKITEWGEALQNVKAQQVWDWLLDVGLTPSRVNRTTYRAEVDYGPQNRSFYLRSALRAIDNSDPGQVRKLMEVLEECLMATRMHDARARLQSALCLDGYTVDEEGNIIDPASAELFELDLGAIGDPSAITQQIGRVHKNLHTNPEEAIDATAALVAAAFKVLLVSHGQTPNSHDLPSLAAQGRPYIKGHYIALGLSGVPMDKITGGLVTVVNGIAPIRNVASPTHADDTARNSEVAAAELVVSAGTAVVRAALESIQNR